MAPSPTLCSTAAAGSGFFSIAGSGSRPGDCWSRPACATSCRTFPGFATGGRAMSCTARTATATRSATAGSASRWAAPGAVRYAQIVRQWTHDLVYFTPPDILTAVERTELLARAIGVVEGTIDQLVIDDSDQLRGVQMRDGCVIARDALFVPPRFVPNSMLLVGLGCEVDARRLGHRRQHRTHQRRRSLGRRERRRPARPGHHRRRRRLRGRHRPQRRPGRRRRAQRGPRPRPRPPGPTHHERPPEGVTMTTPPPNPDPAPSTRPGIADRRPSTNWP